jgi:hypothetical protein
MSDPIGNDYQETTDEPMAYGDHPLIPTPQGISSGHLDMHRWVIRGYGNSFFNDNPKNVPAGRANRGDGPIGFCHVFGSFGFWK